MGNRASRGLKWALAVAGVVLLGFIAAYLTYGVDWSTHLAFPELQPVITVPDGYSLEFADGPDFYTWRLKEAARADGVNRSGLGMYVGLHPNSSWMADAISRTRGRVCGRNVTWYVREFADKGGTFSWRDALFKYKHERGFIEVLVHVWVWADSEDQIDPLLRLLENLSFTERDVTLWKDDYGMNVDPNSRRDTVP